MVHGLPQMNKMNEEAGKIPQWKEPAVPRHVVQMFVHDENGLCLIMHRSNNVRSARNVWSIPSGEQEIGESVYAAIRRELYEEYGLEAKESDLVFQYENIAGDENPPHYHWVISVFVVVVEDVTVAVNREPDKHDKLEFPELFDVLHSLPWKGQHVFHPSLDTRLIPNLKDFFSRK